jgi:phosphatidate cytidylyltransferase
LSNISPNKTVEGTLGGGLLCVIFITLAATNLPIAYNIPWYHWAVIAALTAIFGTLGDLLESKLKRQAGVKDSGKFMPGHGGFLDRFDSLLVAIPVVWVYISFVLGF